MLEHEVEIIVRRYKANPQNILEEPEEIQLIKLRRGISEAGQSVYDLLDSVKDEIQDCIDEDIKDNCEHAFASEDHAFCPTCGQPVVNLAREGNEYEDAIDRQIDEDKL